MPDVHPIAAHYAADAQPGSVVAPGCNVFLFKDGACPSERGAAGTTPQEVRQSALGALGIIAGSIPIFDVAFGGAAEDTAIGDAAAACRGMSFTPGTKVLLASGVAVPIASLQVGDKVLATNTRTGKTRAEPVTAVLVHHDTNRYNVTVKTGHHQTAVIHTTSTHLFWNPTARRWVNAARLRLDNSLRMPAGVTAAVLDGYAPRNRTGWMWDLTVENDHDFYVSTGTIAVLVHNCPVLLGTKADIQSYMASKPEGEFDADFLNIRGTMAGGKGGAGGWTWTRNKAFIDDALNAGKEVRLVTDPNPSLPAPPGGWPYVGGNTYARELNYLIGKGYGWQPVDDYWQITRVGP